MLYILIGGALGGILPTLAKLASTYVTVPETPLPAIGMLLGLIIFAIIGAAIAFGTGQAEVRQALIAGIAAPGIITNLVAGATADPKRTASESQPHLATLWSVGVAHAQDARNPAAAAAPGFRSVTIDPKVQGGLPANAAIPVTVEIKGPNDTVQRVQIGTVSTFSKPTTLAVPVAADKLRIGDHPVAIDGQNTKVDLGVSTQTTVGSDLLWALGGQRTYRIDKIAPKPTPQP
jgi:hypothetical protein